jgi:chromate transporter
MILFGTAMDRFSGFQHAAWLHGLKIVAVAVVAQAVWGMAKSLAPDRARLTMAVVAALIALAVPSAAGQIAAIVLGGVVGLRLVPAAAGGHAHLAIRLPRGLSVAALALFFLLLLALPIAAAVTGQQAVRLADSFYRAGSLVFGGGHVVLPLLRSEVVPNGWVGDNAFLAGYGFAQALPGPLFTFAAFLGAVAGPEPHGWPGAMICLAAIFLPSFLLVLGVLPFWDRLRRQSSVRAALGGVNAAVVGLLLAALYTPVWTSAIAMPRDFALAAVDFLLLVFWRVPPWAVVAIGAAAAALLD